MNENCLAVFEWPQFNTDAERIRYNTQRFKNVSIAEAFSISYGIDIDTSKQDQIANEVKPGDIIKLTILSISKRGVVFDSSNFKEEIVCRTNLYQYERFRQFIPSQPVPAKVISKTQNSIEVDLIDPLLEDFIADRSTNLELQYNTKLPKPVLVHNLRLTRGGYFGAIKVSSVSDFTGKDSYVEAFIPGSQIVLNIENDFTKWEGKTVTAFVTGYINKPYSTNKIFVCSVKEWLRFNGHLNMIQMFKEYCEDTDKWREIQSTHFEGVITGICNTAKTCGAFIEIPSLNITGMIPCERDKVNTFTKIKGKSVSIRIKDFDELKKYNEFADQMQHVEPYIIKNDILEKCNLKLVLELIEY